MLKIFLIYIWSGNCHRARFNTELRPSLTPKLDSLESITIFLPIQPEYITCTFVAVRVTYIPPLRLHNRQY